MRAYPFSIMIRCVFVSAGVWLLMQMSVGFANPDSMATAESEFEQWLKRQDRDQISLYYRIAEDLRCPTCTGLSVLQSDAPFSQQIKRRLRELVDEGQNEDEIRYFFSDRYGIWIFRQPPKHGAHLLIWLIPLMFMVFGLWGGWHLIRSSDPSSHSPRSWASNLESEVAKIQCLHTDHSSSTHDEEKMT